MVNQRAVGFLTHWVKSSVVTLQPMISEPRPTAPRRHPRWIAMTSSITSKAACSSDEDRTWEAMIDYQAINQLRKPCQDLDNCIPYKKAHCKVTHYIRVATVWQGRRLDSWHGLPYELDYEPFVTPRFSRQTWCTCSTQPPSVCDHNIRVQYPYSKYHIVIQRAKVSVLMLCLFKAVWVAEPCMLIGFSVPSWLLGFSPIGVFPPTPKTENFFSFLTHFVFDANIVMSRA